MLSKVRKFLLIATLALLVGGTPIGAANATEANSVQTTVQASAMTQIVSAHTVASVAPDPAEKPIAEKRPGLVGDVAGQYYSFCINLGVSYPWTGKSAASCPGYLDVYINGDHVAHLNTGHNGGPLSFSCAGGVALGLVTLFAPGGEVVGWALAGTLAGIGLTISGCAGV